MAGSGKQSGIEDIRAHNDIVDVIGSYLPLKRAGSSFKALCPFHNEKTPSFHVNPQRQSYHCFGCQAGGDVFKFVMEHEGVDFITAAKLLAQRAGLQFETRERTPGEAGVKEVQYRLHEDLGQMYQRGLQESDAAGPARDYLAGRSLGEEAIRDFAIGYAPPRRGALAAWAKKKGYTAKDLETAGVLVRYEDSSNLYDRFGGRLMFAIRDEIGRVIGFSGRLMDPDAKAAKYVNSPDTPLFHKSRVLYGLDRARRAIVEARRAIICEGQIDVIRCHLAGFTTAVAPQGTALTEEHARILKRYADEVVLVFDADTAGQDAAVRSGEVCLGVELSVLVVSLPEKEDPDSLIREGGAEPFQALLDSAQPLIDYQVRLLGTREDMRSEPGLRRVVKAVQQTISAAPGAVQRDQLLNQAARGLGLNPDALRRDLARNTRRRTSRSAPAPGPDRVAHPREETALAQLLVQNPGNVHLAENYLPLDHLADPDCRAIVVAAIRTAGDDDPGLLMAELTRESDECRRLAAELLAAPPKVPGEMFDPGEDVKDCILRIWRKRLDQARRDLMTRAQAAEGAERERLMVERSHLTMDMERLRQGWASAVHILELNMSGYGGMAEPPAPHPS